MPDADQHNPARRTKMTALLLVIFQHPVAKQTWYIVDCTDKLPAPPAAPYATMEQTSP
jgi:hypothetical protein